MRNNNILLSFYFKFYFYKVTNFSEMHFTSFLSPLIKDLQNPTLRSVIYFNNLIFSKDWLRNLDRIMRDRHNLCFRASSFIFHTTRGSAEYFSPLHFPNANEFANPRYFMGCCCAAARHFNFCHGCCPATRFGARDPAETTNRMIYSLISTVATSSCKCSSTTAFVADQR